MNLSKYLCMLLVAISFTACIGDKKIANIQEIGDVSFVNPNFKTNLINYTKGMSACDKITPASIASMYDVSSSLIHIEDPTKSDRYKKDIPPACMLFVKIGANDYEWLRGSIAINREVGEDEFMGDVAEAAGNGTNWKEAWSLKKSISSSSEWLPNMGKAALWNEKKVMLEIKFDGYTLVVHPLKNILNKEEKTRNRDYKKIAIAMAKAAGYIN